jgi:hypothetical protein
VGTMLPEATRYQLAAKAEAMPRKVVKEVIIHLPPLRPEFCHEMPQESVESCNAVNISSTYRDLHLATDERKGSFQRCTPTIFR